MKTVTKYKAYDGREFTNERECVEHEQECDTIHNIMVGLPERPDNIEFANGYGFIQHRLEIVEAAMQKLLTLVKKHIPDEVVDKAIAMGISSRSTMIGRYFDDCAPRAAYSAWTRFMCIDDSLREWGQPYFANNPVKKEDQVKLN